ncbi:2'-5'-oligoadenylate synthase 2-like [Carlito syrichta]|uniref:2'-5'-oligoadenylate synthase 2-like n=1 Tax=Carlito syrichta TaxID=1868482 RepID=A0A1U7TQ67_CARSF|nr:2'-5'-oligoadenylate synthase 2-like [Carlito syrichta]
MKIWKSQPYSVSAQELGNYIQDYLKPHEDCQKQIDQTVSTICDILNQLRKVQRVAKGGSYCRETVLKGDSDGTFVLFLGDFKQFQDQKKSQRNLSKISSILECSLPKKELPGKTQIQRTQDGLVIKVSTEQQRISFQVVTAFNALGPDENPSPQVYRDLKSSLDKTKAIPGEFAVCFTELQQKFFSNLPRKLKDLILLVKHWYQKCQEKRPELSWLPPYALELLTIYAWEQGCKEEDFNIAEGIRTILKLVKKKDQLCIYWTVYYNFEDETVCNILLNQLQSERPMILDPTDPTNKVSGDKQCWKLLKEEAQNWLTCPRLDNELSWPSWDVLPSPLFAIWDHLLDKFIKDSLQPEEFFLVEINTAVKAICTFLTEKCFQHSPTKIQIVQGGSIAKGTSLKTGSNGHLIVFHDSLKSYTFQKNECCEIMEEIYKQLKAYENFEVKFKISKWEASRMLSFSLESTVLKESVDFDVLPAFNALGQWNSDATPNPEVYVELIELYKSSDTQWGDFSPCFTLLQQKFIRPWPAKLKDLIRLVKHWYKQCEKKLKERDTLPPKYALELLTVYAWEQGSGTEDFDTAEGFRTVLELVTQCQQLCIFWTVNYNFEDETLRNFLLSQIQKTRPVILDPAEPTGDVGGGDRWCWPLLAKEAKEWLLSLCFRAGTENPVQPWKVLVRVI